jgi:peptidyl-prolyl cis-trans isomerase B (cyclophilin B)
MKEKYNIQIQIRNYGNINLELDAKEAPITVNNFIMLINNKFYDGLTFHRIIDGFMIQGGDPLGNGTGGSDNKIKGEFSSNGVNNRIQHKRGTISMARSQDKDSARSQFFIVHQDSLFLDGQYAGFGNVISGIDIVDKIVKNTSVLDSNGTVLKENQPIIDKIIVLD